LVDLGLSPVSKPESRRKRLSEGGRRFRRDLRRPADRKMSAMTGLSMGIRQQLRPARRWADL